MFGAPIKGPGRDVGVALHQPALFPWRTVLNNVMLSAEGLGLPRAAARGAKA